MTNQTKLVTITMPSEVWEEVLRQCERIVLGAIVGRGGRRVERQTLADYLVEHIEKFRVRSK